MNLDFFSDQCYDYSCGLLRPRTGLRGSIRYFVSGAPKCLSVRLGCVFWRRYVAIALRELNFFPAAGLARR
jgi:hypothetical protein